MVTNAILNPDDEFGRLVHDDELHAIYNAAPGDRFTVKRVGKDGSMDMWTWQEGEHGTRTR